MLYIKILNIKFLFIYFKKISKLLLFFLLIIDKLYNHLVGLLR